MLFFKFTGKQTHGKGAVEEGGNSPDVIFVILVYTRGERAFLM